MDHKNLRKYFTTIGNSQDPVTDAKEMEICKAIEKQFKNNNEWQRTSATDPGSQSCDVGANSHKPHLVCCGLHGWVEFDGNGLCLKLERSLRITG